jgi:hypothetical protein
VGRKDKLCLGAVMVRNTRDGLLDTVYYGFDETRMIEKWSKFLDQRGSGANLGARPFDVLEILAAAGTRTERRRDEGQRSTHTGVAQLADRDWEQRMPIAVAPVDWHTATMFRQFRTESGHEFAVLLVDRTIAAKLVVVFGNFQQTFAGYILAASDVF